jgi:mono/diheme cytochrome c family protein
MTMDSARGTTEEPRLPRPWPGGSTVRRREPADAPAPRPRGRWRRRALVAAGYGAILLLPSIAFVIPPAIQLFPPPTKSKLARFMARPAGIAHAPGSGGGADDSVVAYGRQLYQQSCAACHGSGGQGLPHQGAPLVTSKFMAERSDEELLRFLQTGRPANDPHSVLGLVMPARGAPPLDDPQLERVLAFVRTLQKPAAAGATAGGAPPTGNGAAGASPPVRQPATAASASVAGGADGGGAP